MPDGQPLTSAPQVSVARWTFDTGTGHIRAFDARGHEVMTIQTHPLFAARLTAAFSSPPRTARA
jgi:hypothetical protein